MIYLSSDIHLNHANIRVYQSDTRKFKDLDHMNTTIINNFNEIIKPSDLLIHVGDFAMGDKSLHQGFRDRLLFPIYNVIGNHDTKSQVKFDKTFPKLDIIYKGHKIHIQHEPFFDLEGDYDLYLHGHVHSQWLTNKDNKGRVLYNCGIDVHQMKPIALDKILEVVGL